MGNFNRNALIDDYKKTIVSKMTQSFKWADVVMHRLDVYAAMDDAQLLINETRRVLEALESLKDSLCVIPEIDDVVITDVVSDNNDLKVGNPK